MRRKHKTGKHHAELRDALIALALVLSFFYVLLSLYPPTYVFVFKRLSFPAPSTAT